MVYWEKWHWIFSFSFEVKIKEFSFILFLDEAKELYQQGATSNQNLPVVEQKQKESQNVPNVEKIQKDYLEEEMAKKALRNQEIPKYFDSMFGKSFLETEKVSLFNCFFFASCVGTKYFPFIFYTRKVSLNIYIIISEVSVRL